MDVGAWSNIFADGDGIDPEEPPSRSRSTAGSWISI
jgi:hypothetical protein